MEQTEKKTLTDSIGDFITAYRKVILGLLILIFAAAAAFGIGTAVLSAQKKAAFSGSAWCRTSACMSVFGTETFTAYIDKWSPP